MIIRIFCTPRRFFVGWVFFFSTACVLAAPLSDPDQGVASKEDSDKGKYTLFPAKHIYPQYIADPHAATFSVQSMSFSRTDIPHTSDQRTDLKMGGRIGLLQIHGSNGDENGWQLTLETGFHGQFDVQHSTDNIGWDGVYALHLAYRPDARMAYRVGVYHLSSHLGDEYIERNKVNRTVYTRQEFRAGLVRNIGQYWQTYGELGWGFDLRNDDLQEAWRGQAGLQRENLHGSWVPGMGWYSAVDVSAYQERDWDLNTTVQIGLVYPAGARRFRAGFEFYEGRAQIGDLFLSDEKYVSFGVRFEI